MKNSIRITLLATALCCCSHLSGFAKVNLDSLYHVLDMTLDSADYFCQQKMNRITQFKKNFGQAKTEIDRFNWAKKVYLEYVPFENDSAITYEYICADLAKKLKRDDLYAESLVQLAYQLASSGFYQEACLHFDKIPNEVLKGKALEEYLYAKSYLYGEMAYYTQDPFLKKDFTKTSVQLRDSLLNLLDKESLMWMQLHTIMKNNEGKQKEAMVYCNRWLKMCQKGTRPFAIMSFFRSEIYKNMGDKEMRCYWLVQSALIDIREAIMDQGALWTLANLLLEKKQDLERAHCYIDFSWKCLSRFSTHMRSWLAAPVVIHINDEFKNQLQSANHKLEWTIGIISLLVIGLLFSLFYVSKKRKQLSVARNKHRMANEKLTVLNKQLSEKNQELYEANHNFSSANTLLSETNEQLKIAIMHLHDSNRVKDEYIGKFLHMCSEYIDKIDNYRIRVNRKLKANQYHDLLRMTNSDNLKEDELKELFNNFDTIFLRLFPTFIEDFNNLLCPEERITPPDRNHLNTDLRIFALIRLGIQESSKIADFLHYSPNSIYAYRARIKNKAVVNRNDFERLVKEIGIQS